MKSVILLTGLLLFSSAAFAGSPEGTPKVKSNPAALELAASEAPAESPAELSNDEWNEIRALLNMGVGSRSSAIYIIGEDEIDLAIRANKAGCRSYSLNIPPKSKLVHISYDENGRAQVETLVNAGIDWVQASAISEDGNMTIQSEMKSTSIALLN